MAELPDKPWTLSAEEILQKLDVSVDQGLSESDVENRRNQYGANRLQEAKTRSAWQILIEQFKSLIIGILAVAAILSFLFQQWIEGIAVLIAIVVNTTIGFITEYRATRSMQALQQLSRTTTKVRRGGKVQEIASEELVPGDIVVLDSGDVVPADLRPIEASKLQVNESSLTGESVPVSKTLEPIKEEEVSLADRKNMLYKGTALTRGSGEAVVVATGMKTELGHISELAEEAGTAEKTPLEKRLDQLGRKLVWLTLAVAVVIAIAGIIVGKDLFLMVEIAIALAVAAVPEGLPIVATVALARGMWRMAKRNALINKLSAVETLGATSVICTDKTGTLTENRMTVARIALESGEIEITGEGLEPEGQFKREDKTLKPLENQVLKAALEVGMLCNNAALQPKDSNESRAVGDPMEVAFLVVAKKAGLEREELLEKMPEVREEAFDPDLKMMATVHELEGKYRYAVKGAPEAVLNACSRILTESDEKQMSDQDRKHWKERGNHLAADGLRILGLAQKTIGSEDAEAYEDLTFLGVVGLLDPPRQDVRSAIEECQDAGIRVIMVTGDQPVTARNIGLAVGLTDDEKADVIQGKELKSPDELSQDERQRIVQTPILARVSPEQKLNLVTLHQDTNAVVAMTGDGVNDAPALRKADIGVAMGQRGTQVAKEAADMVLQDDAFASIVAAVEQGRAIFNNIRKFTVYLLSGNVGEIIVVGVASLMNVPLPLLPLQILYINVVNDAFPALALGLGEGDPSLMSEPPRDPKEEILARRHWLAIAGYGLVIAAALGGAFALALLWLGFEQKQAVTVSFMTLGFTRLWHVFNMRENDSNILKNEITTNPYVWGALALCTGLLLIAVYVPFLSAALSTVDPGVNGWLLIIGMSFVPLVIGQIVKLFKGKKRSSKRKTA
ncbi:MULTISPECIES: cation-translocating P-type ATPase [unclassified Coleofasciculus]|uniref:cation-translocating P-type ATPase n=1 Tax=unclassified Coleofasciculus TaxID=2692782 RepID=UPI00187FD3AD|nr:MULTISPECIES: cation-transporting P-type ATPase [unclassified Coleofasciculus]MBE9129078.1 cation-transporting P-type ATPase [Coleofasciculus sp. LEGE 07081]MBE9151881.1 cation-transporting P-type ATPase [Coleofasciculus sp. LEGE 07092]